MLIGEKQTFAIECYHEPIQNDTRRVYGRMCIWAEAATLGDIEEPASMLSVTEGHLADVIARLDSLEDNELAQLSDRSLFDFLDQTLYLDDDRTDEQVMEDTEKYSKFDFLTNGGESFDRTKSFIMSVGTNVRLLFKDQEQFHSAHISRDLFIKVVNSFFVWIASEEQNVG